MSFFYGYQSQHESLKSDMTGKLSTSGGEMKGDINMGSNHIITSVDPSQNSHLARKKYVDDLVSGHTSLNYLPKTGGIMTGDITLGNNKISTTANPVSDKDLARKKYVDDQDSRKLSVTGGTMSGNIVMGNNKIQTTSDPTGDKDLSCKKYVDTQDAKKLSLTGGTMTGNLNMGGNKVISSATPSNNNDLTKKSYVDDNFIFVDKTKIHWGNKMDELKGNLMIKNYQIYTIRSPNDGFSLTNKNYVDQEANKRLSKSGGTLSGNLDISGNKIITSSDPTDNNHLTRKKYVDDQDDKKLSLTGGTMSGDITIGNYKIISSSDPTDDNHLTRKIYVDTKLSKTGGTMTGDLDMGNHHIIHASNYTPSSDYHTVTKKYVTNFSLPNTVANIYNLQMDDEGSNKKVEKLLNLSRKKDWNFTQDDTNKQPFFKKSTINNNFYCIQYLGSDSNNLHLVTSQDILSNQHLNFYFVYGLKSLNSSNNEVSLFKINDLGISYKYSSLHVSNSFPLSVPNSSWELKANAIQINKLICLSAHWDQKNTNNPKEGKIYVNGKEIFSFFTA